jgi:aminoglycoside 6-adenylyltransferase
MTTDRPAIAHLQQQAIRWAEERADIRAVMLVGSLARRDHPADDLSDLDLVLFTSDVDAYRAPPDWLAEIGTVWVAIPYQRSDSYPEYLAIFDTGDKADFNFFPISMLDEFEHWTAFQRGARFLLDKDEWATRIPASPFVSPQREKPTQETFTLVVNTFWYNAYQAAKFIRRGELWVAQVRDGMLKESLLQMMEWQAQAQHGWNYDTWHGGRFLAEWVSAPVYAALQQTYARLDSEDQWRALLAGMRLFRQLATEIAALLGYTYAETMDNHITHYINQLYAESST